MSDKKIQIMMADDHRLVRKALKYFLEDHPKFNVIGEAANGKELLDQLKGNTPDLVLLDVEMPVMNGRETLEILLRRFPETKVIMLSMHNDLTYMAEFIAMGARAYIAKDSDEEVFIQAILSVHRNGHYFDETSSIAMLRGLQSEKSINPLMNELALSRRETEILKELCHGKTNKEIAEICNITLTTVNFHRTNIYKKTKSHNITDLIRYSIKNGMITMNIKMVS